MKRVFRDAPPWARCGTSGVLAIPLLADLFACLWRRCGRLNVRIAISDTVSGVATRQTGGESLRPNFVEA